MYLDFYGLRDIPFSITPNPRYVFLSKHHREVFAHLLFGIRRHAGFIEVTGEVGTGKTTVLRTLFLELEKEEAKIAYIFNPCLAAGELLRTVNREFGLEHQAAQTELHGALNTFLLQENAAGRTVVLVIDEAQNLAVEILEQIRLLSNLETETEKLIQIVLVGQPELGVLLDKPELRQLSQRITVRYHLEPMDAEDTASYIEHRLSIAGWTRGQLFTPGAIRKIFKETRGNPRMINVLCDRALLIGYADHIEHIDLPEICRAVKEVRRHHSFTLPPGSYLWLILFVPIIAFVLWTIIKPEMSPKQTPLLAEVIPVTDLFSTEVLPELQQITTVENQRRVVNSLLALWGGKSIVSEVSSIEDRLNLSREQKFEVARLQGDLTGLLQLRLPVILELAVNSEIRYLLLLGRVEGGDVVVSLANGKEVKVFSSRIEPYLKNRAYLLWKNSLAIPVSKGPLQTTRDLVSLQTLLNGAGKSVGISGRYDDATNAAIRTFQLEQDLPVDGIAGLHTLIALYRESPQYGYPAQSAGGVK